MIPERRSLQHSSQGKRKKVKGKRKNKEKGKRIWLCALSLLPFVFPLVPKLGLGTRFRETLFRAWPPPTKRSFVQRRSQTEFGNEGRDLALRSLAFAFCLLP